MSWKTFTPEELVKIKQNPYVKSATAHMIRFTSVFKEELWEQFEKGRSAADIIRTMGFDIVIVLWTVAMVSEVLRSAMLFALHREILSRFQPVPEHAEQSRVFGILRAHRYYLIQAADSIRKHCQWQLKTDPFWHLNFDPLGSI